MAIKNKITDLNNHLFAELERLSDEELKGDELKAEIDRAKAVTSVSSQIIQSGSLALKAEELKLEYGGYKEEIHMPALLEG